jgi:hypothetical protein
MKKRLRVLSAHSFNVPKVLGLGRTLGELPIIGMDIGQPLYDLWNFYKRSIGEIIKSPIHREVLLVNEAPLFYLFC